MMGGEREVEASYASFGRVAWIDLVENPAVPNAISDNPLRSSDILLTRHEDLQRETVDVSCGDNRSAMNRRVLVREHL